MRFLAMTMCCADYYPKQDVWTLGGCSLLFATGCRRAGAAHIAILGAVGTDEHGERIRRHFDSIGVDTSHLHTVEGKSATHRVLIDDSGDRQFVPGTWDGGVYQTYQLTEEDWHFASAHDVISMPLKDPRTDEAIRRLHGQCRMVIDFAAGREFEVYESVLPMLDTAQISGDDQVLERMRPLARRHGCLILVTLGEAGSVALRGGEEIVVPAVPVDPVVDTTGCGDVYFGAFAYHYYTSGDVRGAMEAGAREAARVIGHVGGVP